MILNFYLAKPQKLVAESRKNEESLLSKKKRWTSYLIIEVDSC